MKTYKQFMSEAKDTATEISKVVFSGRNNKSVTSSLKKKFDLPDDEIEQLRNIAKTIMLQVVKTAKIDKSAINFHKTLADFNDTSRDEVEKMRTLMVTKIKKEFSR